MGKHNPKGAGQFGSINDNGDRNKRLPDDTKISL
jgi:hypothetical protein